MRYPSTSFHVLMSIVIGFILATLTSVIALRFGWIAEINLLELFAVVTSYSCTYLCVVQSRWNYPFALVTTIAYSYLFWQWGLYGSAIASLYVPIAVVYGWFRWGSDTNTKPVSMVDGPGWWMSYIALTLTIWGMTNLISWYFGFDIPVMDSAILALTVLAQFLLDNKKLETWAVWLVLNVIAIYLYFTTGLYLAAMQYVLFLMNTLAAGWLWHRSMPITKVYYANDNYNYKTGY